jgi:aryl-alcohol dehydrogenase-like predicted oxidoreductase
VPRYESLQPHYNLYERAEYETTLERVCLQHGLGVIPYFSLAAGFLTGKYRSAADAVGPRAAMVGKYINDRGLRILKALDEVAGEMSVKPASIALAWLIGRPAVTAPIASATTPQQLQDLLKAVDLKLDKSLRAKLDRASSYDPVAASSAPA